MEVFLAMGGYARFVWPAFAISAVVLIGLVVASLRTLRAREAELTRLRQLRPAEPAVAPAGAPAAGGDTAPGRQNQAIAGSLEVRP